MRKSGDLLFNLDFNVFVHLCFFIRIIVLYFVFLLEAKLGIGGRRGSH